MPEDNINNNENVIKKLEEIENRLKTIEAHYLPDLDDALFFGAVFSLLVLFVTLEEGQVSSFLQNTLFFNPVSASQSAFTVKYWGAALALLASALRYYGALNRDQECKSKKFRLLSILSMIVCAELLIFIFFVNIGTNIIKSLPILSLLDLEFRMFLLALFYRFVAWKPEQRLLDFYASRNLIPKMEAQISHVFFLITSASYIALCITYVFAWLGIQRYVEVFITSYLALCLLFLCLFVRRVNVKKTN